MENFYLAAVGRILSGCVGVAATFVGTGFWELRRGGSTSVMNDIEFLYSVNKYYTL